MHRSMLATVAMTSLTGLVLAAQVPPPPPQQQQQRPTELSITLDNPGSHPRIGFQPFAVSDTRADVRAAAETILKVLAADLEFEREFYVISMQASAGVPAASTPQTIPFARWAELGADFVMMGSLRETGGQVAVDVRLINVKRDPGRQDFGQSYSGCTLSTPRYCAHAISDDMHKRLRNLDGVARTRIAFTTDRDAEAALGRPLPDAGPGKDVYSIDP